MNTGHASLVAHRTQQRRRLWQSGFFVLFVLAPWFDLLRYDLTTHHAWFLTFEWHLGLDDFMAGRISPARAIGNVLLLLFLPILATAVIFLAIAWRYGRLYCGWLCPHFSVVETLNRLMIRASGRHSLWDSPVPPWNADGTPALPQRGWWWLTIPLTVVFAFSWAIVFLTYLLPPHEVVGNLLHLAPTRNQLIFLSAATSALSLEFLLGRHLFCRYACAVGLFQSLAWVANDRAMVVSFAQRRASACATCLPDRAAACDAVCPMRLKPRAQKRRMFACTQCGQCIAACAARQMRSPTGSLLGWQSGEAARAAKVRPAPAPPVAER